MNKFNSEKLCRCLKEVDEWWRRTSEIYFKARDQDIKKLYKGENVMALPNLEDHPTQCEAGQPMAKSASLGLAPGRRYVPSNEDLAATVDALSIRIDDLNRRVHKLDNESLYFSKGLIHGLPWRKVVTAILDYLGIKVEHQSDCAVTKIPAARTRKVKVKVDKP